MEEIASGFGLLEGPTIDPAGGVYFSDVIQGGVYRWSPDGVEQAVPKAAAWAASCCTRTAA